MTRFARASFRAVRHIGSLDERPRRGIATTVMALPGCNKGRS